MKVLVMLSGGIDSIATLHYALEQGHDVNCCHIIYNEHSKREYEVCKQACSYLDVKLYKVTYDQSELNNDFLKKKFSNHAIWLLPAVNIAVMTDEFDEIWTGGHAQEGNSYKEQRIKLWPLMKRYAYQGYGEINDTKIKTPLNHLMKRELYDMINDDIKDLTIYCEKAKLPCGQCGKCEEVKKFL